MEEQIKGGSRRGWYWLSDKPVTDKISQSVSFFWSTDMLSDIHNRTVFKIFIGYKWYCLQHISMWIYS